MLLKNNSILREWVLVKYSKLNLIQIVILKKSPKKSKKKLDKEEEKKRTNGRSKVGDSSNEFDTPIIFEKNDFDEIIKKIRNMANDQNRQDKEKKYLKSLLPKF